MASAAVASTRALQLASISIASRDPQGGHIDRNENGEPTGILRETAQAAVLQVIPRPNHEQRTQALELALADLASVEKQLDKQGKLARAGGDKEAQRLVAVLEKLFPALNEAKPARLVELDAGERLLLKPLFLLTMKPMMYVANVAEHGFSGNAMLAAVEARARREGMPVVAISAALEAQIADLDAQEKQLFLNDMGVTEAGLDRLIHAAYALLGLETFFTAGPKEVHAWTFQRGSSASRAAGIIHTDFERGFIRAEVIAYADYVTCKGEQGAKEAGKMRLEGREYLVRDGDVIHFRFNV